MIISLDLTKSSEVRKAGDWCNSRRHRIFSNLVINYNSNSAFMTIFFFIFFRWRYYSHATRLRFKQDILPSTKASQSGLKVLRVTSNEEREHVSTVKQYMHDYVKYLNSHGFTKISTTTEANSKHRAGSRSSASSKKNQKQQQNPQSSKRYKRYKACLKNYD